MGVYVCFTIHITVVKVNFRADILFSVLCNDERPCQRRSHEYLLLTGGDIMFSLYVCIIVSKKGKTLKKIEKKCKRTKYHFINETLKSITDFHEQLKHIHALLKNHVDENIFFNTPHLINFRCKRY